MPYCAAWTAEDPKWKEVPKSRILEGPLGVKSVEKGILLPLRLREDVKRKDFAYEGGVCTETFSFVAGDRRNYDVPDINLSCCKSYSVPDEELVVRQETVVFGGILREHLGDFLTNSTTRLWWFAEHQDTFYKIVFIGRGLLPFELIKQYVRERIFASPYKKIYLSRTLFLLEIWHLGFK